MYKREDALEAPTQTYPWVRAKVGELELWFKLPGVATAQRVRVWMASVQSFTAQRLQDQQARFALALQIAAGETEAPEGWEDPTEEEAAEHAGAVADLLEDI